MKCCVGLHSPMVRKGVPVWLAMFALSCASGAGDLEGSSVGEPSTPLSTAGVPNVAESGATQPSPNGSAQPSSSTGVPTAPSQAVDPGQAADTVPDASRVLRLSHQQFDRVTSDLLGMPVEVSQNFPEEAPTLDGYFDEASLAVNDRLKTELTATAEQLAAAVVATPLAYQTLVGCATLDNTCRDAFLNRFITRAYRRPITDGERLSYTTLFDSAGSLIASGDSFRDGVQLVVEAALQSPNFLYRLDVGSGQTDDLGVRLTGHELASRLSFLFWGTMPDDALFAAASDGSLTTASGLDRELQRISLDPRVDERTLDFHERWLQVASLAGATKDAALYPIFNADLVRDMRDETRLFIKEVTLENSGGIIELLTAPYGFVNNALNGVYGAEGTFGSEFTRVTYPPESVRGGLLTQATFLNGHSSSATGTSPILRGTFVLRHLACFDIPDPPANAVSKMPPAPDQPPVTTRDMFTWKTSMDECTGCHSLINPVGFAFEEFDAIGRYRTQENGAAVDASGQMLVPRAFAFNGAKELSAHLATLPETAACYANNWLKYAYGRSASPADAKTLADLTVSLGSPGFGARHTLVRLAQSAAFTHIKQD